jgi:hypothetical protein
MSWEQLLTVIREQDADDKAAAAARPSACPNDGEPLVVGLGGLVCPYDGWTP